MDFGAWKVSAEKHWERCRDGEDRKVFSKRFDAFVATLPPDFTTWTKDTAALLGKVLGPTDVGIHEALAAWCIRLGFLTQPGAETRWPRHAEKCATPDDGPAFTCRFSYLFQGRVDGDKSPIKGIGMARVRRVDPEDAPVVAELPMAYLEGSVQFRTIDGRQYRSLLAPPTQEEGRIGFLDEAGFVAACSGAEPWPDDPFSASHVGRRITLAHDDIAVEHQGHHRRTERVRDEERTSALERAGELVSVGGRMFRPTSEPRLALDYTSERKTYKTNRPGVVRLAWTCGDLDSDVEPMRYPYVAKFARYMDFRKDYRGRIFALTFPPEAASVARDVAVACAAVAGIPVDTSLADAFSGWSGTALNHEAQVLSWANHNLMGLQVGTKAALLAPWPSEDVPSALRRRAANLPVFKGHYVDQDSVRATIRGTIAPAILCALANHIEASPLHDEEAEFLPMSF